MKLIAILSLTFFSSNLFAIDATCFPFKKAETSGIVRIQTIPNSPELTSKVVALNEEVADKLATLSDVGVLCVKGTATPAGYLTFDAYQF